MEKQSLLRTSSMQTIRNEKKTAIMAIWVSPSEARSSSYFLIELCRAIRPSGELHDWFPWNKFSRWYYTKKRLMLFWNASCWIDMKLYSHGENIIKMANWFVSLLTGTRLQTAWGEIYIWPGRMISMKVILLRQLRPRHAISSIWFVAQWAQRACFETSLSQVESWLWLCHGYGASDDKEFRQMSLKSYWYISLTEIGIQHLSMR